MVEQFVESKRVIYRANGTAIRDARVKAGMTLRGAAKLLSISPTYLCRIETSSDRQVTITEELLQKMAALFLKPSAEHA